MSARSRAAWNTFICSKVLFYSPLLITMKKKDLILHPQHAFQPVLAGVSGPFCKTDKLDMELCQTVVLYSENYFLLQSVMYQIYIQNTLIYSVSEPRDYKIMHVHQ